MTSSYTTNKGLEKPGYNDYVNSWNVPLNSDMDVVDSSLGSTYSIALTNANVNLTQTNCQNARIKLTGLLSANVTIYFPAGVGGFFIIQNTTTGAYTVTLASAGGGTYVAASGGNGVTQSTFIFSDGTNITFADDLRLQLNAGAGISISAGNNPTISNTGVLSFNTRTGSVSLTSSDVTTALGYTPPTPTGTGASGTWAINISGNAATVTNGLTTSNFNSYAPTLTGTGASGTWGINITGNAATVTNGLTTSNYNSYAPTLTGGNASGTWGINVSGNAATVTNGVYNNGGTYGINISGNAATVTNGVYNNSGTYSINITGSSGYASTAGTVSGGYVSAVYAGSGISVNANQGAITISSTLAGGTVTSVATGTGLTGGTITTSGTISLVTTFGAVGTYAILRYVGTGTANYNAGTTYAGSNLRWAYMFLGGQNTPVGGMGTSGDGAAVSGTWQAMNGLHLQSGGGCCSGLSGGGLFVRIA